MTDVKPMTVEELADARKGLDLCASPGSLRAAGLDRTAQAQEDLPRLFATIDALTTANAALFFAADEWQQKCAGVQFKLTEALAQVEVMQGALLRRLRTENGCEHGFFANQCTGWDAELCACAIEARGLVATTAPPAPENRGQDAPNGYGR